MKKVLCFVLSIVVCVSLAATPAYSANVVRDLSYEEAMARDLKQLGLFKGVSETDFDLDRAPSRVEAVVMLIRLLGKESEAQSGIYSHPFSDVPNWAKNYIGYAYEKGLANGVSKTTFGTGDATGAMFVTFVLRALGYSDANSLDFTWSNPFPLAESLGLLPSIVNRSDFWRADAVTVSYKALNVKLKGLDSTLAAKLIIEGAFTTTAFNEHYKKDSNIETTVPTAPSSELSSEQIYNQCTPAVFYIEVYDSAQDILSTGSGFFIDSVGTAVTNYHVIEDAYYAQIVTSDSGKTYAIEGVYDYDIENDWAVIKVSGQGFSFLSLGDTTSIAGGSTVYAIGSPLGLQNTFSQGIISNPSRTEGNVTYIQTTAAISPGSSGGALINKYGEVIGITSATYLSGQNLNLALPVTVIDGYDHTTVHSLTSIATGSEKSEIKGYSKYPEFPDFGALLGVTPMKTVDETFGGTSYYYSHSSLKTAGTYATSVNLFDKVAQEWGFTDVQYYEDDGLYIIEYIRETASATYYIDFAPLDKLNGTDCMSLWLYVEEKTPATGYAKTPAVPDFGAYFGVKPYDIMSINLLDGYYYSFNDLAANGVGSNFFDLYWELLESWGFTYTDSETNSSGTIYTFENQSAGFTINFSAYDERVGVLVFYFVS